MAARCCACSASRWNLSPPTRGNSACSMPTKKRSSSASRAPPIASATASASPSSSSAPPSVPPRKTRRAFRSVASLEAANDFPHNRRMTPRELAAKICRTLREAGHQAFLVGGCVRDLELGREPTDYDISTDARPEQIHDLFPLVIGVGAKFGVMLVPDWTRGVEEPLVSVEVATFRSDVGYSDGRHPDRVVYSDSPREDVFRRDFTINGLLLEPI